MGLINKSAHSVIEIQAIASTEKKPSRFQISISDNIKKVYSRPSAASNFEEELEIVLTQFHKDIEWKMPSSFDVHPTKNGWIAIANK